MKKDITSPNSAWILGRIADAFHLGNESPDLMGRSRLGPLLQGRRFGAEKSTRALADAFSHALLQSRIFPSLSQALRAPAQIPKEDEALLRRCLGEARSVPLDRGGSETERLTERLLWAMEFHEQIFCECRSQEAAAASQPPFAILAPLRFATYDVGVALGLLMSPESVRDPLSLAWVEEKPETTPIRMLGNRIGKNSFSLVRDLLLGESPLNPKTFENLWSGGPDHPNLETMNQTIGEMLLNADNDGKIDETEELASWRRWYGFRSLAYDIAKLTSWDFVRFLVASIHEMWSVVWYSMLKSDASGNLKRRRRDAMIWGGWRTPMIRWMVGQWINPNSPSLISTGPHAERHLDSAVRRDFYAISKGMESDRLLLCNQLSCEGEAYRVSCIRDLGKDAAEAADGALRYVWILQGDPGKTIRGFDGLQHPPQENLVQLRMWLWGHLIESLHDDDWPSVEKYARDLIEKIGTERGFYHYLAHSIKQQRRWDEALRCSDEALACLPNDKSFFHSLRCDLLMDRGNETASASDFAAAYVLLSAMKWDDDWQCALRLSDCSFALGNWPDAYEKADIVQGLRPECGEAYAMAWMASKKMGERKRAVDQEKLARARGAGCLVDVLRSADKNGELGLHPIPRFWRIIRSAPVPSP